MSEAPTAEGTLLWTPSAELTTSCRMAQFLRWLWDERGLEFDGYPELHAFSTERLDVFWQSIWDYFGVLASSPAEQVLRGELPHAHWFDGARLNYAENALRYRDDRLAVIFRSETGERQTLTYRELADLVARARTGLLRLGVKRGDRVAAIAPNRPETLVTFLAAASIGAIFSSCSPEFGVASVLDRFQQIEPRLLIAVDGYTYGGKHFDRREELRRIREALPSLSACVLLGASGGGPGLVPWDELIRASSELEFEAMEFEAPLWILYSSGTTGLPKAIVHGHGGILLEHYKVLALHSNLDRDDRFFWYSTTGWMMWNYLVSGLLLGATLVLYDGSPAHPDLYALWRMAEEERVTYFGVSAPYLLACRKNGVVPRERHDLSAIRSIGTTGAPLPADGFAWVYASVNSDLLLASVSGGTDVCTAFVLSCPLLPVRAGEIQCAGLGAKVLAFDEQGNPVYERVGELVITTPMPSMPIYFWNDPGDVRRLDSYFSAYAGVWRHGDWVKPTASGGFVISGRSDSTLNRGGVRMGTSEFYRVVEAMPEVADSLVVDTGTLTDASGRLWLFVVLREGVSLDEALQSKLRTTVRRELSPRHVPDEIRAVRAIPRTINGKKLEVPVKKILLGSPVEAVASRDTLADPSALDDFASFLRA